MAGPRGAGNTDYLVQFLTGPAGNRGQRGWQRKQLKAQVSTEAHTAGEGSSWGMWPSGHAFPFGLAFWWPSSREGAVGAQGSSQAGG